MFDKEKAYVKCEKDWFLFSDGSDWTITIDPKYTRLHVDDGRDKRLEVDTVNRKCSSAEEALTPLLQELKRLEGVEPVEWVMNAVHDLLEEIVEMINSSEHVRNTDLTVFTSRELEVQITVSSIAIRKNGTVTKVILAERDEAEIAEVLQSELNGECLRDIISGTLCSPKKIAKRIKASQVPFRWKDLDSDLY